MLLYTVVVPVVEAQLVVEDEVVDELCWDVIELCWDVIELCWDVIELCWDVIELCWDVIELCWDVIELCWVVLEGLVAELVLVWEVVLTGPVELADDAGELEDDESEEEL